MSQPAAPFDLPHPTRTPLAWAVAHPRAGLIESLEQYAARAGVTPDEARPHWRMWGALALNLAAPNAPCESGPEPRHVIEGPRMARLDFEDGRSVDVAEPGLDGRLDYPRGQGYPPDHLLEGPRFTPEDGL